MESYYMYSDVKTYVSACEVFKAVKSTTQTTKAPMGAQSVARRPWQILSMNWFSRSLDKT